MAEALLRNVMRNARLALQAPDDYDVRAEIMWAGTLSHNDITGDRSQGDWASHQLEHELGGMFDIAHGAGLAAIWGSWARYVLKQNPCRFAQLAVNVLNVPYSFGNDEKQHLKASQPWKTFSVPLVCLPRSATWRSNLPTLKSKSWHTNAALWAEERSAASSPERCRYGKHLPHGQIKRRLYLLQRLLHSLKHKGQAVKPLVLCVFYSAGVSSSCRFTSSKSTGSIFTELFSSCILRFSSICQSLSLTRLCSHACATFSEGWSKWPYICHL